MERTRKCENLSSTRSIGTQTEFDVYCKIIWQEYMRYFRSVTEEAMRNKQCDEFSTEFKQLYIRSNTKRDMKFNCKCKGRCSSRTCGCVKRRKNCNSLCNCKYNTCQNEKSGDDENDAKNDIHEATEINKSDNSNDEFLMEMFPELKHELMQTILTNKKFEKDDKTETQETSGETSNHVLDINEEKVDWQEHIAQLIRCKKCKRTFMPNRIQKHEACCKGI
ncbi:hypothetical protein ACFW04_009463 [Cataglyphis niger]